MSQAVCVAVSAAFVLAFVGLGSFAVCYCRKVQRRISERGDLFRVWHDEGENPEDVLGTTTTTTTTQENPSATNTTAANDLGADPRS